VFLAPWVDRFFEPGEIELVLALADEPRTGDALKIRLGCGAGEPFDQFLDRACRRAVITRLADGRYEAADFHRRLEIWAMFEGWKDIPPEIRQQLNEWELANYQRDKTHQIQVLKRGAERDPSLIWLTYLLLYEAEELIARVEHIFLWPCNCRAMMGKCRKPTLTCLRFFNDRGIGWEISRERARHIVREANKKGLMQSGEIRITADGKIDGAICNCCADCCYPHLLARNMAAEKLWPLSRYEAWLLADRCTGCGRCIRRCPFGAVELVDVSKGPKAGTAIRLNRDLCRGCGLCATGCPEAAIEMALTGDALRF